MLLLKLLLVPGFLALVTLAGRRWGPSVAGWLAGLPVVAGPILYFLSLELGIEFGARAATASLAAILSAFAFSVTYGRVCRQRGWLGALLIGLCAWFVAAQLLVRLPLSLPLSVALAGAALLAAPRLLPRAVAVVAVRAAPGWDLWLRMAAGAALTVAVTGLAAGIGPAWSGVLSVFPVLSLVLSVSSHRAYGPEFVLALLRAMATGMWSFGAFCLALALALPRLDLVAAFATALATTLAVQWLTRSAGGGGTRPAPPVRRPDAS
ncbi:hypothetical protein [Quisquiliibacterium transsilvanicum]|uniref:Putative membrane protein (GlpM family) n=1 Tax=Quisquiliibacterium transsilvanicum TaxID=1549638 RepID=A0A7W8HMF6_9BURK|nr:hypothetical protein [Quisquiliibacterium transsilvanicum]MBB5273735.1 putative membrane protein (GlpM family) [Quisquiliibacterium transsilvanicum]